VLDVAMAIFNLLIIKCLMKSVAIGTVGRLSRTGNRSTLQAAVPCRNPSGTLQGMRQSGTDT
jgi:hypothetical protein